MDPRRAGVAFLACLAAVYAAARADLWLRARSAYRQGELYLAWSRDPALQRAACDARLAREEERLRADFEAGRLDARELERRLALARLERDRAAAESPLKSAYAWFESSADLFSPPDNRWSRLSRRRLEETRELWGKELKARGIPYHDRMLE